MSFFYPNEINIVNETIDLNYPENEINKRHFEKKINHIANSRKNMQKPIDVEGDYIKTPKTYYDITLSNKEDNLNYSALNPTGFAAQHIYLFGLIHDNIADITDNNSTIVGELVIEHRPKTAVNQKVYTCYLLEESDNEPNDMDNLISFINSDDNKTKNIDFNLNNIIKNQPRCIHYESGFNHVFVFLKTINVNSISAKFFKEKLSVNTDLFDKSASTKISMIEFNKRQKEKKVTIETSENKVESFIGNLFGNTTREGNTNMEDVYIDCQPVNESEETDTAIATVVGSEDGKKKQTLDFYKTVNHFFLFILIAVVCRLSVPFIYKVAIIKNIVMWRDDENEYKEYIRRADYLILFIIGVFMLHYLRIGMSEEDKSVFTLFFMILGALSVFGYSIIQLKKRDLEYMTVIKDDTTTTIEYSDEDKKFDIDLISMVKFPFILLGFALKISFAALWIVLLMVYSIFVNLLKVEDKKFWISEFLFFNTTVLTPLIYLVAKGSTN